MTITFLDKPTGGAAKLPCYSFRVPAGFPSPATDYLEGDISLDDLFELRAPHVYLVKIEGDSMQGSGIFSGDLVIVDRSREAEHCDVVIAALDNEPVCKRLHKRDGVVIDHSYVAQSGNSNSVCMKLRSRKDGLYEAFAAWNREVSFRAYIMQISP